MEKSKNSEINIEEEDPGRIYQLADGTKARCFLYDTNGQEQYDALSDNYYRNADGCLLVYDITNLKSYENIKKIYIPKIKNKCEKNIKVILIGNKTDLDYDRVVKKEEVAKFAADNNFLFKETSCVDNFNINNVFQNIIEGVIFERKNNKNFAKTQSFKIKTENKMNNNSNNPTTKKKKSC